MSAVNLAASGNGGVAGNLAVTNFNSGAAAAGQHLGITGTTPTFKSGMGFTE